MMQLKLFTMQVIPLAISFGIAYWMLVTANMQEGNLRSLGKTLGWSLILVAMVSTLFSYYLFNSSGYGQSEYPAFGGPSHSRDFGPKMDKPQNGEDMMPPPMIKDDDMDEHKEGKGPKEPLHKK